MDGIKVYTDGSSLGNPGPGAWAALVFCGKIPIKLVGGELNTTNNRMEMQAAISALQYVQKHCAGQAVSLHSDSKLLIDTITKGWKRKKNLDLWDELDTLLAEIKVEWIKVKGHSNNQWNNECDRLAVQEAEKIQKDFTIPIKKQTAEFFCRNCRLEIRGKLSWMEKAKLVRVDCEYCGKFVKFAKKTKENLERAKRI
ncbi:MAG: ribonuclease HI [Candidatus Gracilibacteria bacterium]|nr:ribonuclease HI [Candidatus Gracilibacteria bacterium]